MVAKRLHNEGMNAVPHLAARSHRTPIKLTRLHLTGPKLALMKLIIGGGVDQPVGAFDNSLQILKLAFAKTWY